MTTISIVQRFGTDVSSRVSAARLREEILRSDLPATIDFSRVETVSDSFADELIAVLVERQGKEWFREHIRIVGLAPIDRASVLEVVRRRTSLAAAATA